MGKFNDIWVFMEMSENEPKLVSLELLAKARELAEESGSRAIPVICPNASEHSPETIINALKTAIEEGCPSALLFGSTPLGREVSAGLSAVMNLGIASDCTNVIYRESDTDLLFIRPAFDGKLYASVSLDTSPQLGTFSTGIFPLKDDAPDIQTNARTLSLASDENAVRARLVKFIEDAGLADSNIEEASILVAGGRGVGSAEGFDNLRELALLLGGNIAASRAAVEEGWISRDYQVGATGKTVTPKIYFACGISGAVPHVVGMKDSETIIAINTDPTAPIFDVAHYGIVGDLHKVIPELIEIFKQTK
ncbi:MAG: electron transfer flavoprotein subunit alpha/FixB family protein [Frisingicoccus sp.]